MPYIEKKKLKKMRAEIQGLAKEEEGSFNFNNPQVKVDADQVVAQFQVWFASDEQSPFEIAENWAFVRKYYYFKLDHFKLRSNSGTSASSRRSTTRSRRPPRSSCAAAATSSRSSTSSTR